MKPIDRLNVLRRLIRGWLPKEPVRAVPQERKVLARTSVTVALVIVLVVLASFAVYQQMRISSLSSAVSKQSSEIFHPSEGISMLQFSITKENASAEPVMYLALKDNGTVPAESASLLVMVYGANNSINSCYNDTQHIFPLISNESASLLAPLTCGQLGDTVVLSLQVTFTSNTGSTTKVYTDKTTVSQSGAIRVQTWVVNQIGIRTYVIPEVFANGTSYGWSLTLVNDAQVSISGVNATLSWEGQILSRIPGCVLLGGSNIYSVNTRTPLPPRASCSNSGQFLHGPFAVGQLLDVLVSVVYTNGTSATALTSAVVEPPYAFIS